MLNIKTKGNELRVFNIDKNNKITITSTSVSCMCVCHIDKEQAIKIIEFISKQLTDK